jgi:hypothetical protein
MGWPRRVLIAVARRLTSGRVIGIDLWSTRDQSAMPATSRRNASLEGVLDRVEIDRDMRALLLPRLLRSRRLESPSTTFVER